MNGVIAVVSLIVTAWLLLASPITVMRGLLRSTLDRRTVVSHTLGYLAALVLLRIVVTTQSPIVMLVIMGLWAISLVFATVVAVIVARRWHELPSAPAPATGGRWRRPPRSGLIGHYVLLVVVAGVMATPVVFG